MKSFGLGRAALGVTLILGLLSPGAARAADSIWERARHPEAARRRELAAEAQTYELKAYMFARREGLDGKDLTDLLAHVALLLEQAGAATSPDLFLRYRLASVYETQNERQKALALLESIARADAPPPLRAAVFAEMGVAYAHLGRVDDEIRAYGEALKVQPLASERARLLANRAEAYMLLGDVSAAVEGYRAALSLLSSDHMSRLGPTTLWGLAVALDRSGDLDSSLDTVRVARTYDAQDKHLNSPDWAYVPLYDRHWYEALGHWQVARKADSLGSVRADAYAHAVASLEEFVTSAARDDKWLPLARVRLKQCEKERAAFLRRYHPPIPRSSPGRIAPWSGD